MAISILHRATGIALAVAGGIGFVWWLLAISDGKESYLAFRECADAWYGLVIKIGLTWAFFQHLCSGVRHFFLDIGTGYELNANKSGTIAAFIMAIILTAATWGYLWYGKG
jgi:succinate dehydrogenase / fumarate reductase cytochrome b subunit